MKKAAQRQRIDDVLAATRPLRCLQCSTVNWPNAVFCTHCGTTQLQRMTAEESPGLWDGVPGPKAKLMRFIMKLPLGTASSDGAPPDTGG